MRTSFAAALAASLALVAGPVPAQDYPSRPIQIIVPSEPGGTTDLLARAVQAKLADAYKQPVVVVNRPGANGIIGTQQAAKAPGDGYTLLEGYVANIAINPAIYGAKLSYNPTEELVPVASLATLPFFLLVDAKLPVNNLAEFVAYAKARDGQLAYSSAGVGGSIHLAAHLFATAAGITMVHVPYNGNAPARNALLGGNVAAMFDNGQGLQYVKSGRLKVLGVTSAKRIPAQPDIPAIAETYPGYEATSWHGIFAPRGTPKAVIDKLNATITAGFKDPETLKLLATAAMEPLYLPPEAFRGYIDTEIRKWADVVRAAGAKAD